jgi:hypothetical protein
MIKIFVMAASFGLQYSMNPHKRQISIQSGVGRDRDTLQPAKTEARRATGEKKGPGLLGAGPSSRRSLWSDCFFV